MDQKVQLTRREWQVVELLLQGKSNKLIASALGITSRTVEFHLKNVYAKCTVSSRVELILKLRGTTGPTDSQKPGNSTVARKQLQTENRGIHYREIIPVPAEEPNMNNSFRTREAATGAVTAFATAAAWVLLMRRFGHFNVSEALWWMPILAVLMAALGASAGALARRNGRSQVRLVASTLIGTGIAPFTVIPIVLVTVYPLGKLAESLGLIQRATLPANLASNVVIAAMLATWAIVGAGVSALLLRLSIVKPQAAAADLMPSDHARP